jgi:hypothetical protein
MIAEDVALIDALVAVILVMAVAVAFLKAVYEGVKKAFALAQPALHVRKLRTTRWTK